MFPLKTSIILKSVIIGDQQCNVASSFPVSSERIKNNFLDTLASLDFMLSPGTGHATKSDELSEKFQRGVGRGIFNPKIYIADFGNFSLLYFYFSF